MVSKMARIADDEAAWLTRHYPGLTAYQTATVTIVEGRLSFTAEHGSEELSDSYTVKIEFWIDTTGRVTGIKALTNFGFGMEEELIRVISKSVLWTPAKQGDSLVRERKLQTITFNAGK